MPCGLLPAILRNFERRIRIIVDVAYLRIEELLDMGSWDSDIVIFRRRRQSRKLANCSAPSRCSGSRAQGSRALQMDPMPIASGNPTR